MSRREGVKNVKDGKVVNAHEYQDAYGFLHVATRMPEAAKPAGDAQKQALAAAREVLAQVAIPLTPGDGEVKLKASSIHAAAAKVELAASGL